MLLSQLFKNVDSYNSLNSKCGCSEHWVVNDAQPYWVRIYRDDRGLTSFISSYDVDWLFGSFDVPFLVGVERIKDVQRVVLSVAKTFFESCA